MQRLHDIADTSGDKGGDMGLVEDIDEAEDMEVDDASLALIQKMMSGNIDKTNASDDTESLDENDLKSEEQVQEVEDEGENEVMEPLSAQERVWLRQRQIMGEGNVASAPLERERGDPYEKDEKTIDAQVDY